MYVYIYSQLSVDLIETYAVGELVQRRGRGYIYGEDNYSAPYLVMPGQVVISKLNPVHN